MATDPVCGMYVDEATADLRLVRDNRTYYFCAAHCLAEFAEPAAALARFRRKLAVGWPIAILVVALTYAQPFAVWPWVAAGLSAIVQFYPGRTFYTSTWDAIKNRNWNMDVLIAVGTSAAFGYGVASLLLPGRLPTAFYFDASSAIVVLILTGNYLEHLTRERARGALRALQNLLPTKAVVVRGGQEVEIAVAEVLEGDEFRVRPGGRFPADGTVLEGRSTVNEALLTGESLPVEKGVGSPVIAGSVNGDGALRVTASRVGEDTVLAQIGQMISEAETSRVPLQQLADRIASAFVPVVLVLALAAGVGWFLAGAGLAIALIAFVSVVIIACPCAFGIATPAAVVVAIGRGAEGGVLFKSKDAIERASRIDLVLTDKTGTLTRGAPAVVRVVPRPGGNPRDVLTLAAAVESGSEHPLARAVRSEASREGLAAPVARDVRAVPGEGVRGTVGVEEVAVLNGRASRASGADLAAYSDQLVEFEAQGFAWSSVLRGREVVGVIAFSDPVAPSARDAVRTLADDGMRVVMATGDHAAAARTMAREVGITEVHDSLGPGGKLELLRRLQSEGHRVAFVGDGVNDAPALAAADLGIAIGAGADVAREAGGVVLMRPDLTGVALALRLGRRTVRKVRGNLTWALGYNAILIPIAMGALVPVWGLAVFTVLPIAGAAAMGLSSTTVVLNSLSLRSVRLDVGAVPRAGGLTVAEAPPYSRSVG